MLGWLDDIERATLDNSTFRTVLFTGPHAQLTVMSLQPGDVISTGTPAGVGLGQKPPKYLRPGNVVRLGIDGLGEQRQVCRAAD